MNIKTTCKCEENNPFSFENVLATLGQINKTIYGINPHEGLTEKEELVADDKYANLSLEDDVYDQTECEDCGKVACMCYEEKLEREN